MRRRLRALLTLSTAVLASTLAAAQTPTLTSLAPAGAERGREVALELRGRILDGALDLVLDRPGVSVVSFESGTGQSARAVVAVAADAPLGPHGVRVRTARGLSNLLPFHVGRLPDVQELEPNGELAEAQPVALGVTVHGTLSGEDQDLFAIDVLAGTQVRALALGVQLGNAGVDPLIEICDADGSVLARGDDDALLRRDALVELTAPRDGRILVRVRDAARAARRGSRYLLHLDAGWQPRVAMPLAVPASTAEERAKPVTPPVARMLLGAAGPLGTATPRAAELRPASGWLPRGVSAWWPEASLAPLLLRHSALATTSEREPNDSRDAAAPLAVPGAYEGALGAPGDVDVVVVELAQGETVELSLWARRLRSPLDGALEVRGPDSQTVREDDTDGADPVVRFTPRRGGPHHVTISDHLGRGGPAFVYRLEVQRPTPRVEATLVGTSKALAVPRGGRAFVALAPDAAELDAPLTASFADLPAGVTAHAPAAPMQGGQPVVVLAAAADAPLGHGHATLELVAHGEAGTLSGALRDEVTLATGRNNLVLAAQAVETLAVAVVEAAPFSVELGVPDVPFARACRVDVVVRVARDAAGPGFAGPLTVGLAGLPPGVRTVASQRIEPADLEAKFTLELAGDARLGAGALVAWAEGVVDGTLVRVASGLASIDVVPPLVALAPQRAEIERNGSGELRVDLAPASPAAAACTATCIGASVTLVGLPHDVTATPVLWARPAPAPSAPDASTTPGDASTAPPVEAPAEAPAETHTEAPPSVVAELPATLALPLAAGSSASLGLHRGLTVEARLELPGGVVVQTQGGAELRVKDAPTVAVASDAAPSSRRERLRDEHAAHLAAEAAAAAEGAPADPLRHAFAALSRHAPGSAGPPEAAVPTFGNDVLPILTARGCNAGACHGASQGQDGFHLSLFGFDPQGDRERIVAERFGRRLDPAFPERSLLLEKATGAVPHTGGAILAVGDVDHATLVAWIRAGAPADPPSLPRVTRLELEPRALALRGPDAEAKLTARAHYSDGTSRDVTRLALFRTDNASSARVDVDGRVHVGVPGKAFLTASFATETVGTEVVVLAAEPTHEWRDPADAPGAEARAPRTWIDAQLEDGLRRREVAPLPLVGDDLYLRRVSLDLVGRVPTIEERAAFLADARPSAEKRAALVDELLARPEFVDQWVMRLAELLRVRSSTEVPEKVAQGWFEWLQRALRDGLALDEIVRRQLTATGTSFAAPETAYFLVERDAKVMAENFAQAFLGVRISCAQCHNHPFDRWTQDDYTGLVAFFAEVRPKRAEDPSEWSVADRRSGDARHPVTNQPVPPKFLGGAAPSVARGERRAALAAWLTAPDNPWFARNVANRVWAAYMGRGLVEPVDDVRVSNPPANEALLAALAARLVSSGYDLRDLAREIVSSRAYQRAASVPFADDMVDGAGAIDARACDEFAAFRVRRLRAETLADSLAEATNAHDDHPGLPAGKSAALIADGAKGGDFLTTFGRAPRLSVCACEVSDSPSLSQALHLVNGATVHEKVARGGVVAALLKEGLADAEVIDVLYARALSRAPSEDELAALTELVATAGPARATALEDVFWALLTSNEFLFQH